MNHHMMHAAFADALDADLATEAGPMSAAPSALKGPKPAMIRARDGANLAYTDWGDGAPVVFVGSWALPSRMWEAQIAALASGSVRCVTFDRRGHGRSPDPGRGYDMDTLADDLAAVLEQLDLTGVTLVGHSMGCAEVIRYLARHGDARVRQLVLLSPAAPCLMQTPDNPYGLPAAAHEQVRQAWIADFPKWVADNARPFYTPETSPEMVAYGERMILECPLPVILATNRALITADLRGDCAKVALPTLVVHGDADVSAPLEITGERVAALIPGARLVVIPGAPHGMFTTHAQVVNAHIADAVGA